MIRYTRGYKYQLEEEFSLLTPVRPRPLIDERFLRLTEGGVLTCRAGYAWDGCSGPTWDTPSTMRAGLVHDAFYQLLRRAYLPSSWREAIDDFFRTLLLQDGCLPVRAWYYWRAVRSFGGPAATGRREVFEAP